MRALLLGLSALSLSACSFTLDRAVSPGEIRGTLVFTTTSSDVIPAKSAHVAVEGTNLSAVSDEQGRFSFLNLPPGTYAIDITASQAGTDVADSGLRLQGLTLVPIAGDKANGLDLGTVSVGAFGAIAGSVMQGSLADGAVAVLSGISQAVVEGGQFQFPNLGAGDYTVALYLPGSQGNPGQVVPPVAVHVVPRLRAPVTIDFTTATTMSGNIEGLAQLAGASTSQGVSVTLSGPTPAMATTMNAGGLYDQTQLEPGVYTITAHAMGFEDVTVPFVVLAGNTTEAPTITLTTYYVPLADGGIETDAEHIAAACGEAADCQSLPPFTSVMNCESIIGSVLTQLEQTTPCNPAADAFSNLIDCLATATCASFATGDVCAEQDAQFNAATSAVPACATIAAALQGNQSDGGPTTTMDGGAVPDGGSLCGDTMSDTSNCGSCGHVCGPSPAGATLACEFGACLYTRAANQTNAEPLLVDSSNLYWTIIDFTGSTPTFGIITVPVSGGTPSTFATLDSSTTAVTQDTENIYWGTSSGIMKQPKSGGSATTLLSSLPGAGVVNQPLTDLTSIYWSDVTTGIYSVSFSGGSVSTLTEGVSVTALALDSTSLYWVNNTTGDIVQADKTGASPVTLATSPETIDSIVVNSGFLYWSTYADPGIVAKVSVSGTGMPVTLANGAATNDGEINDSQAVVVEGSKVYWGNYGSGTIYGASTSGSGTPFRITAEQANPPSLAVDSMNLYWSTSSAIVSTPLPP